MRCIVLAILGLVVALPSFAADVPAPSGDTIVGPDAKLELLFTRTAKINGGLTEGPAAAPDGSIYFSDIPLGKDKGLIMRFDPKSKRTTVFAEDSRKSNGLAFDREGRLVACEGADEGGRCVSRWDVKTGKRTVVADKYMGKRFNAPNDLAIDRMGRIYFSDPRYLGFETRELEHRAVYRIDTDGKVHEVTHDISKPNGVALSPDDKTLYVADHDNGTDRIDPKEPPPKRGDMKIYAWMLGSDGLVAGERRTFYDFGDEIGCDGMTVDEKGNLYLTGRSTNRPAVIVLSPAGKEIARIPTGPTNQKVDAEHPAVGLPSNVEFGISSEANVLYITVDVSLYRIPLKVKGYHPELGKP